MKPDGINHDNMCKQNVLPQLLNLVDTCTDKCLKTIINTNSRQINQLLIKMLLKSQFTSHGNDYNINSKPSKIFESITKTKYQQSKKLTRKKKRQLQSRNKHKEKKLTIQDIPDDCVQLALSYLSPNDIHFVFSFNPSYYWSTMHCTCKWFNMLMKRNYNHRAVCYSSLPILISMETIENIDYHNLYTFNNDKFITLGQLFGTTGIQMENIDFQFPDGFIAAVRVNNFQWPLLDKPANINVDIEYWCVNQQINKITLPSNSRIFYQNTLFGKNIWHMPLNKETLTNFCSSTETSQRLIKYKKHKFGNLNQLYGNDWIKLVDINLQGLYNHFIFDKKNWNLLCPFSIGQIAYFITKRHWTVGIIELSEQRTPKRHIAFKIDITAEINALKHLKHVFNDPDGEILKQSNVLRHTNRYYVTFYTQSDNEGIIDLFGNHTNKQQQSTIWQTYYSQFIEFRHYAFIDLRPIVYFQFEKMYDYWFFRDISKTSNHNKHYNNYNHIRSHSVTSKRYQNKRKFNFISKIRLDKIGYLLVDYIKDGKWTCGILMYNSSQKYIRYQHELEGHIGYVVCQFYQDLNQNSDLKHLGIGQEIVHLDQMDIIGYFGSHTTSTQQKNMLLMMIQNFEKLNKSVVAKLRKIL